MIYSAEYEISFRGAPATLCVVRNNGYCWGIITTPSGEQFDVWDTEDQYDQCDEDAALAFENAAAFPANVEESRSSIGK